jgi:hypothetical protein
MTEGVGRVIIDATGGNIADVDSEGRVGIKNQPNMDVALSTRATEATVAGVKTGTDKIPADPAREGGNLATLAGKDFATSAKQDTLIGHVDAVESLLTSLDGKDFATQTTLATLLTQATGAAIQAVLEAIRDTAGVKKITDALPTGDNIIGRVKLSDGTDLLAISTGGQAHFVLYDDVNNVAMAVNDGDPIPANTRSLLASGIDQTGDARRLELIEDEAESGLYRLAITGKVSVIVSPPPEGGTRVAYYADNPLEISQATSPHLTEYDIPDGDTLHIQQIIAGCQGDPSADGSKVEIYYWDGTTDHLVDRIYVTGETQFGNYPDTDTSRDGTAMVGMPTAGEGTIRIYRSRLSNSAQEIDAIVRGYTI